MFGAGAPQAKSSPLPAVIYFALLCVALLADIERNLGWHPAFIRVWDVRASIYFAFFSYWEAIIAGAALSAELRSKAVSPRFRHMASWMIVTSIFAVIFADLHLSKASSSGEVFFSLFVALAVGVGGGILGILMGSGGANERQPWSGRRLHACAAVATVGALAVASAFLLPQREVDNGKVEIVAEFGGTDLSLTLAISEPPVGGVKFGTLRIQKGQEANLLVLERSEWRALADLWSRAKDSTSTEYHPIGEMHDTELSDPTRLSISAEQGIRFAVSSKHGASLVFNLPRSDIPRFDAAIRQIENSLPD